MTGNLWINSAWNQTSTGLDSPADLDDEDEVFHTRRHHDADIFTTPSEAEGAPVQVGLTLLGLVEVVATRGVVICRIQGINPRCAVTSFRKRGKMLN